MNNQKECFPPSILSVSLILWATDCLSGGPTCPDSQHWWSHWWRWRCGSLRLLRGKTLSLPHHLLLTEWLGGVEDPSVFLSTWTMVSQENVRRWYFSTLLEPRLWDSSIVSWPDRSGSWLLSPIVSPWLSSLTPVFYSQPLTIVTDSCLL